MLIDIILSLSIVGLLLVLHDTRQHLKAGLAAQVDINASQLSFNANQLKVNDTLIKAGEGHD